MTFKPYCQEFFIKAEHENSIIKNLQTYYYWIILKLSEIHCLSDIQLSERNPVAHGVNVFVSDKFHVKSNLLSK